MYLFLILTFGSAGISMYVSRAVNTKKQFRADLAKYDPSGHHHQLPYEAW